MALGVLLDAHVQVYAAAAAVRPSASAGALARRQLALAAGEPAFPKLHTGRRIGTPPIVGPHVPHKAVRSSGS